VTAIIALSFLKAVERQLELMHDDGGFGVSVLLFQTFIFPSVDVTSDVILCGGTKMSVGVGKADMEVPKGHRIGQTCITKVIVCPKLYDFFL